MWLCVRVLVRTLRAVCKEREHGKEDIPREQTVLAAANAKGELHLSLDCRNIKKGRSEYTHI